MDRLGVDSFVAGLDALLTPARGVAILDMEGGWPFGLETYLRESAEARNLNFYVRRGPMLTNFGYVLSTRPLEDDVSSDPFQIDARFVDFGLVSFAPSVLLFVSLAKAGASGTSRRRRWAIVDEEPAIPSPFRILGRSGMVRDPS